MSNEINALESHMKLFSDELENKMDDLIAQAIDEYIKAKHNDDIPVYEYMRLIETSAITLIEVFFKNISVAAAYRDDVSLIETMIEEMKNHYHETIVNNFDEMKDSIVSLIAKSAEKRSIH